MQKFIETCANVFPNGSVLCLNLSVFFCVHTFISFDKIPNTTDLNSKCLKIQFKIGPLLICLFCVDKTLFYPPNESYFSIKWLNKQTKKKTGQEMREKQPMSKDELCEDFSERLGHCAQDHF